MATQKGKTGRVAVIGLGAYGIVTVKNMLEIGFDVVGFEQHDYIGGLWKATTDPSQTSVLPTTIANISKQRNCFTDFPFPDDAPNHPTSVQMQQYLENFADHFNLRPHFRLGVTIAHIKRSKDDKNWAVSTKHPYSDVIEEEFDKLVVTTGTFHTAIMPQIPGIANFKGNLLHCQSFKDTKEYKDKVVVVLGLSNSGADTTVELAKVVKKVYISHRSGCRILPRLVEGAKPADHLATRRLGHIAGMLAKISPTLMNGIIKHVMEKNMRQSYPNLDPAWRLLPAPPPSHATPIINDKFIDLLARGAATNKPGIEKISDTGVVIFTDGTEVADVDAIICCTGYRVDYNNLDPEIDPTHGPTPEYDAAPFGSSVRRYTRLYQGIFSPKYPDSLAFIGPYLIIMAFTGADVASQAIGQIFSGAYPLPPRTEIERWCDAHYVWSVKQAHIGRTPLGIVKKGEVEGWLDKVCGNGLDKKLGWGIEGWKFWWQEKELRDLLMTGVDTGFAYRLFDGRRTKWMGARDAIYRANGRSWTGKD